MQIGVGLMVFQQATGINGIGFYTAETFVAAGKWSEQSFYAIFKNKRKETNYTHLICLKL